MAEPEETQVKPASLRWRSPGWYIWFLILGIAISSVFCGFLGYITLFLITNPSPQSTSFFLASNSTLFIILVSSIIGAFSHKRWLARQCEKAAYNWVFPPQTTTRHLLFLLLALLGIVIITNVTNGYLDRLVIDGSIWGGIFFGMWLGICCWAILQFVYYPEYKRVYQHAQEIHQDALGAVAVSSISRQSVGWSILPVLGILIVLGFVIGLQWGMPRYLAHEPAEFVTVPSGASAATQLTYGVNAFAPQFSPDGKSIAYLAGLDQSELVIMRPNGKAKRILACNLAIVIGSNAVKWSPDGMHIAVSALPRIKTLAQQKAAEAHKGEYIDALWIVEASTGRARHIPGTEDSISAAFAWVSPNELLLDTGKNGRSAFFLLNIASGRMRNLAGSESDKKYILSTHIWHAGQDAILIGRKQAAGIWLLQIRTAQLTQISTRPVLWAMPLDEKRLIIGVPGQAHPPIEKATSVAILTPATGDIQWVVQDIQGLMTDIHLIHNRKRLLFSLFTIEPSGLWSLSLQEHRLEWFSDSTQPFDANSAGDIVYWAESQYHKHWLKSLLDSEIWITKLPQH
jgi:hypothetical protein